MEEIDIEQIRKKTLESRKGPVIDRYVEVINKAINRAAGDGKNSIDPWATLSRLRMPGPSEEERRAIVIYYTSREFVVQDHPNPDPGHPASRPYTTLSW